MSTGNYFKRAKVPNQCLHSTSSVLINIILAATWTTPSAVYDDPHSSVRKFGGPGRDYGHSYSFTEDASTHNSDFLESSVESDNKNYSSRSSLETASHSCSMFATQLKLTK